jgi:Lrp/AsnC family leucine-responsive transcriptional regulator
MQAMSKPPVSRPPIGRALLRETPPPGCTGAGLPTNCMLAPDAAPRHPSAAAATQGDCPRARAGECVPVHQARGVDETDLRILDLLQRDGRITNLKLAEQLDLLPGTARDRVRRLTREGYILGYEAVLNPIKLAAGVLVFTHVRLEKTGVGVADAFRAAVQVRAEILECHEVAGDFDYLIKTRAADIHAYRGMLASLIWSLPGVRDTRTFAVMEEVKTTTQLPL